MKANLQILQYNRVELYNNLILDYFNINSLPNKVTDLRIIFKDLSLDHFVLSETKLDESFPIAHFNLESYKIKVEKIEINTA